MNAASKCDMPDKTFTVGPCLPVLPGQAIHDNSNVKEMRYVD